jgi:hypothetical protein
MLAAHAEGLSHAEFTAVLKRCDQCPRLRALAARVRLQSILVGAALLVVGFALVSILVVGLTVGE